MIKPLSKFYTALTKTERLFFKLFHFLSYQPSVPVVSIGNLSTGGTGKTPLLFEFLELFSHKKVAVLTRGYKSKYERNFFLLRGFPSHIDGFTDETLLLAKRFPDTPIFIGKNRRHSAIMAEKLIKPELILLDDGFQYRRIKNKYNILLWDSTIAERQALILPSGTLREPPQRLKDADLILLTRCESATEAQIKHWKRWLANYAPNTQIIKTETQTKGLFNYEGNRVEPAKSSCLSFCAIGNPASFYSQLKNIGITPSQKLEYSDHHVFSEKDIQAITKKGVGKQIICTEKDFIKISKHTAREHNILYLKIGVKPVGEESFAALIKSIETSIFGFQSSE